MESDDLFALTEEHWHAINQLNEILALSADLDEAFKTGLALILTTLGRSGGALYLPRFCEHIGQDWTQVNVPSAWQKMLSDEQSPLFMKVAQAIQTRQVQPGDAALEIGAIIPLVNEARSLGALIVSGPVILPARYPLWRAMLRPFARTVIMHAAMSGTPSKETNYRELLRSRNTLRTLFDSLPIAIYIIDSDYTIAAINRSRADRIAETPRHLVGGKCYEILYQRTNPCPGCRVSETFATGNNTSRMCRYWLDTDQFIEWEVSTFPIYDEKDVIRQAIVIEQDVTEKRNLEANLIQSEKLAAVGQLAAGVAHEINNPLTAIIANAQVLRHEIDGTTPENADLLDSIKLIEMAGTRASQVVRNLLGIARKEKYEFEPVDINETLQNALSLAQHELVGRPIQVELDLGDNLPRMVASQDHLQGVWINLLLNAIDAIDKDPGKISINSRLVGNQILVTITDNGKGISVDHLPRLFEPFFTTKTPGRGTGLGLSVAMRAVKHHGGDIQVDSQPGQWTRFVVSLPVEIP